MRFAKCPVCGEITHLNVSDSRKWYAEKYPNVTPGSLVPARCFYCWTELAVGDPIVVRRCLAGPPQAAPGDSGVIEAVLSSPEHGAIYQVKLESGLQRYFVRAELGPPDPGDA